MNNYFMETHHHEWILTNKKGGYALGTGNLINQRKYHGLLVAGDKELNRIHLVAGMEEKVEWRGEIIHLDSNNYSNCIYPEGFLYLVKPWLRPHPIFLYSALPHQNDILIRKEIFIDENSNTVMIRYTNLGHHKLHFEFHPKYTMHNHHEINYPGSLDYENFETQSSNNETGCSFYARRPGNDTKVYGYALQAEVFENRFVYYNVFYPWDAMKGYAGVGDQITLFEIRFDLKVGEEKCILFSDMPIEAAEKTMKRILKRYKSLPLPHDYPHKPDNDDTLLSRINFDDGNLFSVKEYRKILEFMLQDFIMKDDVLAGYPWYGSNSPDTMFFLNALLYNPDNLEFVDKVSMKYLRNMKDNLLTVNADEPVNDVNYVSLEATFGLISVLCKSALIKDSKEYLKKHIQIIEKILLAISNNKDYPFHVRKDGLIELHEEYAGSTWMNSLVDGKPITPRNGVPIELSSAWYDAIYNYEELCESYNQNNNDIHPAESSLLKIRDKIPASFDKLWSDGYYADRLIDDEPVIDIRPNALLAAALPHSHMPDEKIKAVFDVVFKELYTFYGIRTLHPKDTKFRKKYYGIQSERNLALHNGSVWAWLFGPFCELFVKLHRGKDSNAQIVKRLEDFFGSLRNGLMKGHISSIAEIWDGDAPHFPKGSPSFARSVAALYIIEMNIQNLEGDKQ
jgi:predicted glycogen debranching enzyme